ncbi:MAG: YggS family pyridoxal phosphate-dependent enzyme [Saprospiraceae bacterium]
MYQEINSYCSAHKVTLLVVSKMRSNDEIRQIYDQGQRLFAENRVQDLVEKAALLPHDIEWHLIGSLQTNKVKYIAPFIQLIHSLDDIKLWKEINKQASKLHRSIPCLLQIKIASEESKSGFHWEELIKLLETKTWHEYTSVPVLGVMGMATMTDDRTIVQNEFRQLKKYFIELREKFFPSEEFSIISMGMSGDYKIAIEEGSTMVRVGSLVFSKP